jgi:peptidoglycan hydrolase CwlO-like protein
MIMKKFFLMSLIAAFVMVLNVNAQDNTYNMVVKMLNGTEITIGPNEIENIFFNDGEIVVKGTKLEELLKRLAEVKVWTIGEDGYWYLDGQKTEFKATGGDGQSVDYKPMIAKVEDELLAAQEKHKDDFELLKVQIEQAKKEAREIALNQNPDTNEFLRELMERVDRNTKEIDTLKAEIEELRKQLNNGSRTR